MMENFYEVQQSIQVVNWWET